MENATEKVRKDDRGISMIIYIHNCTCYFKHPCLYVDAMTGSQTTLFIIQRRLWDSGEISSTDVLQSFAEDFNKWVIRFLLCRRNIWKIFKLHIRHRITSKLPKHTKALELFKRIWRSERQLRFVSKTNEVNRKLLKTIKWKTHKNNDIRTV